MNFKAYLDEGYDENSRKLFVMAGFYGSEADWAQFATTWSAVLAKYNIEYFHVRETQRAAPNLRVNADQMFDELIGVIDSFERIFPVACRLDLSSVDATVRQRFERARMLSQGSSISDSLGNLWFLAFQYVVERTITEAQQNWILCGGDKMDFVFDQQVQLDRRAPLISDGTRSDPNLAFGRYVGTVSFASKKVAVPLQSADMLANEALNEKTPWETGRSRFLRLAKRCRVIAELPPEAILRVLADFEELANSRVSG